MTTPSHPETEIVGFVRGELTESERHRVEAHLVACAECRATADAFRGLLTELAASTPSAPIAPWTTYRSELRTKLDRRGATGRASRPHLPWLRPVPFALSAALAGVLVYLAVRGPVESPRVADLTTVEEVSIGHRLELLQRYSLLEHLDLLEDLEVIRNLDQLSSVRGG